jgi:hypothetical protein
MASLTRAGLVPGLLARTTLLYGEEQFPVELTIDTRGEDAGFIDFARGSLCAWPQTPGPAPSASTRTAMRTRFAGRFTGDFDAMLDRLRAAAKQTLEPRGAASAIRAVAIRLRRDFVIVSPPSAQSRGAHDRENAAVALYEPVRQRPAPANSPWAVSGARRPRPAAIGKIMV